MLFLTYWFVSFACVALPLYWLVPVRAVRLAADADHRLAYQARHPVGP